MFDSFSLKQSVLNLILALGISVLRVVAVGLWFKVFDILTYVPKVKLTVKILAKES